ncbi:hypothetical protein CN610_19780 [Bacillus wiedmannii]|nr:hypothetical protein CN610_19780 [Bacillus wiedmannii]
MFEVGEFYPSPLHKERIDRYKRNSKLFKGEQQEVFEKHAPQLQGRYRDTLYVSANLAGIICKKSADFLFGESAAFSAGKEDGSPEQEALERFAEENGISITNYESALSNAYKGDSFYKVRWGQEYGGMLPASVDKFRVIIENQNPEYVFPETVQGNADKVLCYHVAYPVQVAASSHDDWLLNVESHYPGRVEFRKFRIDPIVTNKHGIVEQFVIKEELATERKTQNTGVPFPLIVHVPNYSTADSWEGIDDLSEHYTLLSEINNRISLIADILDKHSNPAIAVPVGTLEEDENGVPTFRVGVDKVFEVMGKEDVIPQYITWNGELQSAFQELDKLIELLLTMAEIPTVALGKGDSGTSGASGLSIKWRMNSLLAKVNRKRQYYDKGLKRVLLIAQLLEQFVLKDKLGYEVTIPKINFKDGLPNDDMEQVTIMATRLAGMPTLSQKTAIMKLDGLTEEQAEKEIERMKEEAEAAMLADPSIFNAEAPAAPGEEPAAKPAEKPKEE